MPLTLFLGVLGPANDILGYVGTPEIENLDIYIMEYAQI
jgi:hypothetical protein